MSLLAVSCTSLIEWRVEVEPETDKKKTFDYQIGIVLAFFPEKIF